MSKLYSKQVDHNGSPLSDAVSALENAEEYSHPPTHPVSMITGALSETEIDNRIAVKADKNGDVNENFATKALTVTGDLTVNGTTTTVNSQNVTTSDSLIEVNNGEAGAGVTSVLAGIEVDRGTLTNYQIVFDESVDMFSVGEVGDLEVIASQNYVNSEVGPKATMKIFNETFLSGQTQLVINDAFIVEATCKVDVQPEADKDGEWSAAYADGSITITSDTAESVNVPVTIYVTKAGL